MALEATRSPPRGAEVVRDSLGARAMRDDAPGRAADEACAAGGGNKNSPVSSIVGSAGSASLLLDPGEPGGEGDGGREAGKELALARRTRTGAFTMEARLAYSRVLLESSK